MDNVPLYPMITKVGTGEGGYWLNYGLENNLT